MTFNLHLSLDTDAMATPAGLAAALHKLAERIDGVNAVQRWSQCPEFAESIRDENGNTVGSYEFVANLHDDE